MSAYDAGRIDQLAGTFDENAETNLRRGRTAIRKEYEELFKLSTRRRMVINEMHWSHTGDRAKAKGDLTVRIVWRDGREAEQRVAVDMDIVARDGHPVIGRLMHQVH